jgi:hypothetical protein
VADHYGKMGFERVSAADDGSRSAWRLGLSGYEPKNRSIKDITYV